MREGKFFIPSKISFQQRSLFCFDMRFSSLLSVAFLASAAAQSNSTSSPNNNTISIPAQNTYILPPHYQGNFTEDFIQINNTNTSIPSLLNVPHSKPFISYSSEFLSLLGPNPQLISYQPGSSFAFEGGV